MWVSCPLNVHCNHGENLENLGQNLGQVWFYAFLNSRSTPSTSFLSLTSALRSDFLYEVEGPDWRGLSS